MNIDELELNVVFIVPVVDFRLKNDIDIFVGNLLGILRHVPADCRKPLAAVFKDKAQMRIFAPDCFALAYVKVLANKLRFRVTHAERFQK